MYTNGPMSYVEQQTLFSPATGKAVLPHGLTLQTDFITEAEESTLLFAMTELEFHEIRIHGQIAKRTAKHFGYGYDFEKRDLIPGEPLPQQFQWLAERCAKLARVASHELVEVLFQHYPPGAPIGWHRDADPFGLIIGVSLRSTCRMRFQRGAGAARETAEIDLVPRSAYILAGAARDVWQHSIPPTKDHRYSITFRTLRQRELV